MAEDKQLTHLIITRYNLPFAWGRRTDIHNDSDWLARRKRLFEEWCLPAVSRAMLNTDATWLVACADDSPDSLRDWMTKLEDAHPWLKPIFISDGILDLHQILSTLEHEGWKLSRYILSTRLDSDDVILPHFLCSVQRVARRCLAKSPSEECPRTMLNFALGFQIGATGKSYFSIHPSNAFLSILDDRLSINGFASCYDYSHPDAFRHVTKIRQLGRPSWVQLLHGDNEGNTIAGLRIPTAHCPDIGFGLPLESRSRLKGLFADAVGVKTQLGILLFQRTAFFASFTKR